MSFYIASRTKHAEMWRKFRAAGAKISSSWIDDPTDAGLLTDKAFSDFWERVEREIKFASDMLVVYIEPDDFPLKGALVEVGIALGCNKQVVVCAPGVEVEERTFRPIGSWIKHPNVSRDDKFLELLPK